MPLIIPNPIKATASLFDRGFDPAKARKLPVLNEAGESNIRGLYFAGEIAGTPLIKLGLNRGRAVIDHIVNNDLKQSESTSESDTFDVLIVGAGCAGLGAADRCQQLGLSYIVLEGQRTIQTVRNMTKNKPLYMEPPNEDNHSRLFCEECPKEQLLEEWEKQLTELGIAPNIREYETVENIQPRTDTDAFKVTTNKAEYNARRVILAIGMAGNPRKLRVNGEDEHPARISQNVSDPDEFRGQDLLVFGAGDVACEAAIALADRDNLITMVAPDQEFSFPKQRNIDGVMERVQSGRIDLCLGHVAESISPSTVTIKNLNTSETKEVKAEHIFRCIGADLPLGFFKKIGVRLEGQWYLKRWLMLFVLFLICYFIYGAKTYPPLWPFNIPMSLLGSEQSFGQWWASLSIGSGNWKYPINGSFWYSLAYCLVMTWFGIKAYRRWGIRYNDSYQKKRFISLIVVQWTLAFLIPMGLMWLIHGLWPNNSILGWRGNYWHASGFEYAFPLFFVQFVKDVGWLYLIYGLAATFVIIPLTSIWHGKRYCTWFCGCGGLAETLGDSWRHLAPKGKVSQRWEWMNTAVLVWAVIAIVLVVGKIGLGHWISDTNYHDPTVAGEGWLTTTLFNGYKSIADVWLVGIIPVALYPIFGGKIWCRYWCPLAKWMQMISKWFGTLQISSNDKCITCGECSRYCEVGIDVMSYAKNQQSFHNENTSCIHCGICITVCPMDVLSFDNDKQSIIKGRLTGQSSKVKLTINGKPD